LRISGRNKGISSTILSPPYGQTNICCTKKRKTFLSQVALLAEVSGFLEIPISGLKIFWILAEQNMYTWFVVQYKYLWISGQIPPCKTHS